MSPPMIQNMSKPRRASSESRREVMADEAVTCLGPTSLAEAGIVSPLLVTFVTAKVEADEFVFAASVKEAVGESRMSADLSGKNLRASERCEGGRGGWSANEFAFFGQDEE